MKVQAKSKYLKISASKLRLNADVVRGMSVLQAFDTLVNANQKAAGLLYDTLKSAVANAENNLNLKKSSLVIDEIRVDQGPKLKRFRPRARGSASRILHPMAHLTIVVSDQPNAALKQPEKTTAQQKPRTQVAATAPKEKQ